MSGALYYQLETTLLNAGSIISPAEAHGALCGIVSLSSTFDINAWMSFIIDEQTQTDSQVNQQSELDADLAELQDITQNGFDPTSGGMDLLLPPDDADLPDRLQALASWCEGFLYGVGISGSELDKKNKLSESAEEFITDVREIGKLDTESEDEDAEHYYMELVEYIRVGLLVFREEVQANAIISYSQSNKRPH
ncbi:MAG: UPF0149 family protein [Gammaproteobacteria bacterium]